MNRAAILAASAFALALSSASPVAAQGNGNGNGAGGDGNTEPPGCINSGVPAKNKNCNGEPVALTVQSNIDFGRLVLVGDGVGHVVLDLSSGSKLVFGGLDDLGGFAVKGQALVTGAPNRVIVVDMPTSITMADPAGGQAQLRDIVTNIPSLPVLDGNGQMVFEFSGTLYTDSATALGGTLRGRIPISVQYN